MVLRIDSEVDAVDRRSHITNIMGEDHVFICGYLEEIENRKSQGLSPKPIDDGALLKEVIAQIKDTANEHRADSLHYFIYNTLPGTTSAAGEKAEFLKQIILGEAQVEEISTAFAFELLSHMKGGPSIKVLLDLALGDDEVIAKDAAAVLKTQVFLYEADTSRLKDAHDAGNAIATDVIESYAKAEFFTKLPDINEKIKSSPMLRLKVIFQLICCLLVMWLIHVLTANCLVNADFRTCAS